MNQFQRSARVSDPAGTADRRSPALVETFGQTGGSVGRPATAPFKHPRSSIYYWKCDRPAAFHGTGETFRRDTSEKLLADVLRERFPGKPVALRPAAGQGNHITWLVAVDGMELFVRIEDGPERDDYIEVESRVLEEVRALGVPAPRVHGVDASRQRVPFAWQQTLSTVQAHS